MSSLFVAFLPLRHRGVIQEDANYANDERPRVKATLFSTEWLPIFWSVFRIPQPSVDIFSPCV